MSTLQCDPLRDLPWLLTAKQVRLAFGLTKEDLRKLREAGNLNRHAPGKKGKYFKSELIVLCRVPHQVKA